MRFSSSIASILLAIVFFQANCQKTYAQSTLYFEGFSNGTATGWSFDSPTGIGTALIGRNTDNFPTPSGDYMFLDPNRKIGNGNKAPRTYPNNSYIIFYSPTLNLAGKDKMRLSFDMFLETGQTDIDGATLLMSSNNEDYVPIGVINQYGMVGNGAVNFYNTARVQKLAENGLTPIGWGVNSNGWRRSEIDLPPQAVDNKQVRFAFVFAADDVPNDVSGFAIDNFEITGYNQQAPVYSDCGNGIKNKLELWLNPVTLDHLNSGDPVSEWRNFSSLNENTNTKQEWTSAFATGTQRPIYYDAASSNVNFNPVLTFDGSKEMFGKSGFYSDEIFIVINPVNSISSTRMTEDVFLGDDYRDGGQDVTGLSINNTSIRYPFRDASGNPIPTEDPNDEPTDYIQKPDIAAYNQGSSSGYGRAIISNTIKYDRPVIFNARIKADGTGMDLFLDGVGLGSTLSPALMDEVNNDQFSKILNSRYWLGRSEFFGPSFDGDILEVMCFSERKSDLDRRRIESYLAIKYGITLGLYPQPEIGLPHVPGVYFDYAGNLLWHPSTDAGYTYNVTGIGRDDCSFLDQKQAKSIDPNTFITIGLGEIAGTNNLNPNQFLSNGDYLMWGSTPSTLQALPDPLQVNLGSNLVTTLTDVSERTWKFKEFSIDGNDIPAVKVSVESGGLASLPVLVGADAYVMIIADDEEFTSNVETVFLTTNGTLQECFYDFDGIKFVKFGVAHEVIEPRHIDFDGIDDFIAFGDELDVASSFTLSAWIKVEGTNSTNGDRTIMTKRAGGTDGYQFFVNNGNKVGMRFNNTQFNISNSTIENDKWTYVAFTYDGTSGRMYIDGFLDNIKNMGAPLSNQNKFSIGSRYIDKNTLSDSFNGKIDEIRIFSMALTIDQIRFLMNQELLENGAELKGSVIPTTVTKNEVAGINWNTLDAYFNMNTYIGTHLNDASGKSHRASLLSPENFDIQVQTAPLPYVTKVDGYWNELSTWQGADELFVPGSTRIINGSSVEVDWNIVKVANNVILGFQDVSLLGLDIDADKALYMSDDKGVTVTHLLQLNGILDLWGSSQLVQTDLSDLETGINGYILRDQQGNADGYSYNYWSSPVSSFSNLPNTTATIKDVMWDGSIASSPRPLNFTDFDSPDAIPAVEDGAALTVSSRWLYKYGNLTSGTYSNWEYLGPDGSLKAGEGWSMKGSFTQKSNQNYTFLGKPNNGTIELPITNGNDYLIGNPYPSALDADQFLMDNTDLDGTLYFWEHWGGGSHILKEYQGGYSSYNLSGGAATPTYGTSHPLVNSGGSGVILPKRYVPVAQGFFVTGTSTGTIQFNNTQRQFVKESSGQSVFTSAPGAAPQADQQYLTTGDERTKIRLGFDSPNLIHRQLLLTIDPHATAGFDRGYDGAQFGAMFDDMAWKIDNENYSIQGIDVLDQDTRLPLEVTLRDNGVIRIGIDYLDHFPASRELFIYDQVAGSYTNIMEQSFESEYLFRGIHADRFFLVLEKAGTLGLPGQDALDNSIKVFKPASQQFIKVINLSSENIEQIIATNLLGQQVKVWNHIDGASELELSYNGLATGAYMITVVTDKGKQNYKVLLD